MSQENGDPAAATALASRNALSVLAEDHAELAALLDESERLAGDSAQADRAGIVSRVCGVTLAHSRIEEEVLLPALKQAGIGDDELEASMDARARAAQLASEIGPKSPTDPGYGASAAALAAAVRAQILVEQRSLFPLARSAGVDLDALGARLGRRRAELIPPASAD